MTDEKQETFTTKPTIVTADNCNELRVGDVLTFSVGSPEPGTIVGATRNHVEVSYPDGSTYEVSRYSLRAGCTAVRPAQLNETTRAVVTADAAPNDAVQPGHALAHRYLKGRYSKDGQRYAWWNDDDEVWQVGPASWLEQLTGLLVLAGEENQRKARALWDRGKNNQEIKSWGLVGLGQCVRRWDDERERPRRGMVCDCEPTGAVLVAWIDVYGYEMIEPADLRGVSLD